MNTDHPSRSTRAGVALLAALLTALAWPASARAQDGVLVVPHGGARALDQLTLEPDGGGWRVVTLAQVPVLPDEEEPRTLADARVLPDGRVLVAGLSDEGVGASDLGAGTFEWLWEPSTPFSENESAAVVSYGVGDAPTRLLITDTVPSLLFVWDVAQARMTWQRSMFIPGARAFMQQAIALPNARVAVATNWRSVGVYGVDILSLNPEADGELSHRRVANRAHEGAPADFVEQPELDELHELMALDEDTLLVTTRFAIFSMELDGAINWSLRLSDLEDQGGEFASARALPSGHMAVATYEPGRWTAPHPNHRVHWFALDGDQPPTLLASSAALTRAPRRVLSRDGTGGTGTLGYQTGVEPTEEGTLDQLVQTRALTLQPSVVRPGQALRGDAQLTNSGEGVLRLARVSVFAQPGGFCLDVVDGAELLHEERAVELMPFGQLDLTFTRDVDAPLEIAEDWCAVLAAQDEQGEWKLFAGSEEFRVIPADEETGYYQVPSEDLRVAVGEPDMGGEAMEVERMEPIVIDPGGGDEGCQCDSAAGRPTPGGAALLALPALLWWRRRQR